MAEILNFLTNGKSQRTVETAFNEEKFLKNLSKLTGEKIEKIFDAEIFTDVFSKMEVKDFEDIKYKIINKNIRNKVFDKSKVLGRFNVIIDMTRFQKAHYEVTKEMLHQNNDGVMIWYQAVEEIKMVANNMAISMCSEIVKNTDGETKQDCEINAMKRLLPKLHGYFSRLEIRILGDGLYACEAFLNICEKYKWEYIVVLKDKKIPTVEAEYERLVGLEKDNIEIEEKEKTIKIMQWVNGIEYKGKKVNVLEEITYNKIRKEQSRWLWITNREITKRNVKILIKTAKERSYIENQGFKEQKKTSGIELEHVYSKNFEAMQIIYQLIQIAHMILQFIEHSDITGNFRKKYGSVKVFAKKLYATLIYNEITDIELQEVSCCKIQIRFP